jgi:hypothetical protein
MNDEMEGVWKELVRLFKVLLAFSWSEGGKTRDISIIISELRAEK